MVIPSNPMVNTSLSALSSRRSRSFSNEMISREVIEHVVVYPLNMFLKLILDTFITLSIPI